MRLRSPLSWLVWRFGPVRTPFHYDRRAADDATAAFEAMARDPWCRRFVIPSGITYHVRRTCHVRKPIELLGGGVLGESFSEIVYHCPTWLHFADRFCDPSVVSGFAFRRCSCVEDGAAVRRAGEKRTTLGEWLRRMSH